MCWLAAAATVFSGCAALQQGRPMPTETDFATIRPGMTRDEVLARFGQPSWSFRVRQENMTVMNYRYNPNDCTIYQVSVLPDGIVHDANQANDPGCDRPKRGF
jgi:hypothetical protein